MRASLVIGAALAPGACGDHDTRSDEAKMAADDMMIDRNMAMDPMMNGTISGLDPATQNMIEQDMNNNDPDADLANGLQSPSLEPLPRRQLDDRALAALRVLPSWSATASGFTHR